VVVLPIPIHIDLDFFDDESVYRNDIHLIVRVVFLELLASLFDDFFCVCHILFFFDYNTKIRKTPEMGWVLAQVGSFLILRR
jgi:hypothetical protein